jgi:hypothetical protein
MNAITQMITQQLSGTVSRQIAAKLGVSESTANMAVQMAIPLIIAALARNAKKPDEADALHQAVANDHDGSILDNLMGYMSNPQAANGAGILGHVLGAQQPAVANNLAQATGMDQNSAGSLLEMVAPIVMGAVGREQQQNGLDSQGLSQYLGEQQEEAQSANPDMMGSLHSMLDSNNDGSVSDDLQRIAGNSFKEGNQIV